MVKFTKDTIVEALLFASVDPVPAGKLAQAAGLEEEEVLASIGGLNAQYERENRAFRIMEISSGYQFRTLPELSEFLKGLARQIAAHRLSHASLETLAIVAYRQPISRVEIEKIRGVSASGVLKNLLEKKLITVCGRAQVLGRPLLYGTTADFLRYFGLADLSHLPRESELQVILSEQEGRTDAQAEPGEEDNGGPPGQPILL